MIGKLRSLLLCTLIILLFNNCNTEVKINDGLWILKDEDGLEYKVMVKSDTVYHEAHGPMTLEKKNGKLTFIHDNDKELKLEYAIHKNQTDNYLLNDLEFNKNLEFKKSLANNSFDHFTTKYGKKINLPKGYSNLKLGYNRFEFIYGDNELDSLIFDNKLMSYQDFFNHIKNVENYSITNFVFALDENLPFKDFVILYQDIYQYQGESILNIYHSFNNKPECSIGCLPWETISYEVNILRFTSDFPSLNQLENDISIININIKNDGNYKVNNETISKDQIFNNLTEYYNNNHEKALFKIIETENLTYGDYISLSSMIKSIVLKQRDQYSKQEFNKSWSVLNRYDLRIPNSKETRDSLCNVVKSMFPKAIYVQKINDYD